MSGNQDTTDRGQRSWSAPPPDHRHSTAEDRQAHPQRYVSRLNIPMNTTQTPTEYSTEQPNPQVQQQQPQQQGSNSGNIRHIPIFVEGRDEPVYPKDQQSSSSSNMTSSKPPRPQQSKQQQQQPQPPPSQQQPQVQRQEPSPTPPPPPPPPVNPIQQKLEHIMDELNRLAKEIKALAWPTTRQDKAYIYIDEMLTRCLIQLDSLETGGDDNLRLARRELVRRTQCCITELEDRLKPPPPDMTPVLVGPIAEPYCTLKRPKKTDEPMETSHDNQAVMLGPVAEPKPQLQRPNNHHKPGKTDHENVQQPVLLGPVAQPQPQVQRPKNKEAEVKTNGEKLEPESVSSSVAASTSQS